MTQENKIRQQDPEVEEKPGKAGLETEVERKPEKAEKEKKAEKPGKTLGKKALGAAAAVTTGTAVLINGLFGSPDEIMKAADEVNRPSVVQMIDDTSVDDDDETEEEEEEDESGPTTLWGKLRSWIWTWPLALRILICLPLWALGWGVCQGAHLLWQLFLSPVLKAASGVLLLFAVLAGVLALAARAVFPELPLREVFKKSRLIALGICSIVLEAFIGLLPAIDTNLEAYSGLIRFGGGALIIAGLMISLWITKERRKRFVLQAEAA
ncbi:MAG: hypothetical protein J5496_06285 [Lachnospiraceae bacterium]|nr:hypothetical protein [Lachnospiraceae bacterium]